MTQTQHTTIGIIGLGSMGSGVATNLLSQGFKVAAYDRDQTKLQEFSAAAHTSTNNALQQAFIIKCTNLPDLLSSLTSPKILLLFLPAGAPTRCVLDELAELLTPDDCIIDCANSHSADTEKSERLLAKLGIPLIGAGVSGGLVGARTGLCVMYGMDPAISTKVQAAAKEILSAISAKTQDSSLALLCVGGRASAGHFVKTVHNGIEYANMQILAEIYSILSLSSPGQHEYLRQVFSSWQQGPCGSFLLDAVCQILDKKDEKTQKPLITLVKNKCKMNGTGTWSTLHALDLQKTFNIGAEAVFCRILSCEDRLLLESKKSNLQQHANSSISHDNWSQGDLEKALYIATLISYAQGFSLIREYSRVKNLNTNLGELARIWQTACIIRSNILCKIEENLQNAHLESILFLPNMHHAVEKCIPALRRTIAKASLSGTPVPALSSALAYFDLICTGQPGMPLVALLRDYFGGHGYERNDTGLMEKTKWN